MSENQSEPDRVNEFHADFVRGGARDNTRPVNEAKCCGRPQMDHTSALAHLGDREAPHTKGIASASAIRVRNRSVTPISEFDTYLPMSPTIKTEYDRLIS